MECAGDCSRPSGIRGGRARWRRRMITPPRRRQRRGSHSAGATLEMTEAGLSESAEIWASCPRLAPAVEGRSSRGRRYRAATRAQNADRSVAARSCSHIRCDGESASAPTVQSYYGLARIRLGAALAFATWVDAVDALQAFETVATIAQMDAAANLGLELPDSTPRVVATALLHERVDAVSGREPRSVTEAQQELIGDLVEFLEAGEEPQAFGYDVAYAWVAILLRRRARHALTKLRIRSGDLVESTRTPGELDAVSSIGADGQVYFRGPNSPQAPPHLLEVKYRAGDHTSEVRRALETTRNRRAPANVVSGPPGEAQIASIAAYQVHGQASAEDVEILVRTVDQAEDERPLQRLLTDHPALLASLMSGNHGRYVLPKVRLADRYETDFAVADLDSAGFHWTLIELESPTAHVALRDGRLAQTPRHALDQIHDWRQWIGEHLDTARRTRAELGTGLLQISSRPPGLVIVGRRGEMSRLDNAERDRLEGENRIRLKSWDWLIEQVGQGQRLGYGPLGWDDQLEAEFEFL